jgi:hypothetical protein
MQIVIALIAVPILGVFAARQITSTAQEDSGFMFVGIIALLVTLYYCF